MERWEDAQDAERGFWSTPGFGLKKFRRAAAGSIETAEWVMPHLKAPPGDWLEVGIGPLGVGCTHYLGCQGELHTLDPIEPTPADEWQLPEPCKALVRSCQEASIRHVGQAGRLKIRREQLHLRGNGEHARPRSGPRRGPVRGAARARSRRPALCRRRHGVTLGEAR